MKEYLKMADGFDFDEAAIEQRLFGGCISKEEATYAAHAVVSHDALVAGVERLRVVIEQIKSPTNDDCMNFLCCAFRHCDYEIKGDFEIGDMKPAFVLYANSKCA